jgi:hypothetical protein
LKDRDERISAERREDERIKGEGTDCKMRRTKIRRQVQGGRVKRGGGTQGQK